MQKLLLWPKREHTYLRECETLMWSKENHFSPYVIDFFAVVIAKLRVTIRETTLQRSQFASFPAFVNTDDSDRQAFTLPGAQNRAKYSGEPSKAGKRYRAGGTDRLTYQQGQEGPGDFNSSSRVS